LAYISGSVDEQWRLRNEYLAAENRMLRHQIEGWIPLTDTERQTLAQIGQTLGKQALEEDRHSRQTRYPPGLASQTGGSEIRGFQAAKIGGSSPYRLGT
jgi:hypothetical protein